MVVMGVATYFLLGFGVCSMGLEKPMPSTINLVKGPRKESTTIVLLNAHVSNCLPNTHMHICRLVLFSDLVREPSHSCRWQLMRKHNWSKYQELMMTELSALIRTRCHPLAQTDSILC